MDAVAVGIDVVVASAGRVVVRGRSGSGRRTPGCRSLRRWVDDDRLVRREAFDGEVLDGEVSDGEVLDSEAADGEVSDGEAVGVVAGRTASCDRGAAVVAAAEYRPPAVGVVVTAVFAVPPVSAAPTTRKRMHP
nr:hypothetical protein [Cryptosporangium phraense]